jgi:HTH-type transcriptional regulator/antitoxin HipB
MRIAMALVNTTSELGHTLKSMRRQRKLSQEELGKKLGLSQERISVIENHPERITVDQLFTVLMALSAEMLVAPRPSQVGSGEDKNRMSDDKIPSPKGAW